MRNGVVPHEPHELLHSTVGLTGWEEDEEAGEAGQGGAPRLVVMDLRSYTATLGNRAKGGGSECTGQSSGSTHTSTHEHTHVHMCAHTHTHTPREE